MKRLLLVVAFCSVMHAEKMTAPELIALASSNPAALELSIRESFPERQLKAGSGYLSREADFFFAIQATSKPLLVIDDRPGPEMLSAGGDLWYAVSRVTPTGALHKFHYLVNGAKFGGTNDLPAYGPMSEKQAGVPEGKLSDALVHTSKIYPGMATKYWIYVPVQYDAKTAVPLMVFQDGWGYRDREGNHRVLTAIDNLIAANKIPVMICVFVDPGDVSNAPGTDLYNFVKAYSDSSRRIMTTAMRSIEYDTVSDRYARFLRDELLPEVYAKYNIRRDAYSRGIGGLSSGAIAAFNAAWHMPDQFSRVLTWVGSFTNIQWKNDPAIHEGGQDYPDKVLRESKRNLRVWLQDGSEDMENESWGSWPLANIRMANALKTKGYDFHFSFSHGSHNLNHGGAEFPAQMIWLWRGYDPAKTAEVYEQEEAEKRLPLFRVQIVNRDAK